MNSDIVRLEKEIEIDIDYLQPTSIKVIEQSWRYNLQDMSSISLTT